MTNTKDKILIGLIIILILLLIGSHIKGNWDKDELLDQVTAANKHVLELDEVKKEADGQYAKLVDNYQSEKQLNERVSKINKELYKSIKKKDEKILMLKEAIVTLESAASSGDVTVNEKDSSVLDLILNYPNPDSSFINWKGSISMLDYKYKGEWSFGSLPLQIILTETERGMWNSRLIGPNWLKVDSMEIKSLPKKDIVDVKKRKFGFLAGGGLSTSLDNNGSKAIIIGGGLYYNNEMLILNASTRNIISLEYYHRFNNSKNK